MPKRRSDSELPSTREPDSKRAPLPELRRFANEKPSGKTANESETLREQAEQANKLREQIATSGKKPGIDADILGDYLDAKVNKNRQIVLSSAESKLLRTETETFFNEVKDSKAATNKGYKVAAAYDAQIQGWTTRSKIIEIAGKRMFALCNYPASWFRRRSDRLMEWLSGDPMRKPKSKNWKRTVESRNTIPTVAGTPENMVVMPFIESINAYDVFANQREIKDFGPFGWAEHLSIDDRIDLLGPIAQEVERVHSQEKSWGEAILPNVIFTKKRRPILIDPETTYEGIPMVEQRALDVRNLITSACGAFARSENMRDFGRIARRILDAYTDPETIAALSKICRKPLSWRKKVFFNIFSKFRIGSTDHDEFQEVCQAIVREIERQG